MQDIMSRALVPYRYYISLFLHRNYMFKTLDESSILKGRAGNIKDSWQESNIQYELDINSCPPQQKHEGATEYVASTGCEKVLQT